MIKIIEQYTGSKTGIESLNEDGILINDRFVAVVDGATSKKPDNEQEMFSGRTIKEAIISAIDSLNGNETYLEAFEIIKNRILKDSSESVVGKTCASILIYSKNKKEIWSVGDCQLMIGGRNCSEKKRIDTVLSEARAIALEIMLQQGYSIEDLVSCDKGRELILPLLKVQNYLENKDCEYGYSILNNSSADCDISKIVSVYPVEYGTEIIMASDGYPFLMETLELSEKKLSAVLKNDPLCFRLFKSTKGLVKGNISYDDRTYVRFLA